MDIGTAGPPRPVNRAGRRQEGDQRDRLADGDVTANVERRGHEATKPRLLMASRASGPRRGRPRSRSAMTQLLLVMVIAFGASACKSNPFSAEENPTSRTAASPTTTPSPTQVELVIAISRKLIAVDAMGDGLRSVKLTVRSYAKKPLRLQILSGTIFDPESPDVQTMVLRRSIDLNVAPGEEAEVALDAACADMTLEEPGDLDAFTIKKARPGDLTRLVRSRQFQDIGFRLQQLAIWTVTDNPPRSGYAGISESAFVGGLIGRGTELTNKEIRLIRRIFRQARINEDKYRALR